MTGLRHDVTYGVRMLLKRPGFTLVAVLTLALGIGANSAIFSVVNAVLLRPLPYEEAERLVRIGGRDLRRAAEAPGTFSPPDFYDWRAQSANVFEGVAAIDGWSPSLTGTGEPERLQAAKVSANFFSLLRAAPALGRTFMPEEERRGNHYVVVLGHGLWQRRFGGDPSIVGRQIELTGEKLLVVGIMPREFQMPRFTGYDYEEPELWIPFAPDLANWTRSGRSVDAGIARLKAGVTVEQAQAEMDQIGRGLQEQYPKSNATATVKVVSLYEQLVGATRPALLVFVAAVGFVLLIACANVANLLLARSAARQKEIAIRAALGASRVRVVRQLLTESVLLSLVGGALGLLLAMWANDLLLALSAGAVPRIEGAGLDARVLLFTFAVSVLTGVVFGLAPALQASKTDLNETLKDGGRTHSAGRGRVRALLVVSEVALSLVLLVGAGLLIKSFARLSAVDPGFDTENVLTMTVFLNGKKYPRDEEHPVFFDAVVERARALPDVEHVGLVSNLPVSGNFDRISIYPEGQLIVEGEAQDTEQYMVNADYFGALRIPLREGRIFTSEDRSEAPPAVVVSESTAHNFWPNESAVGKRIKTGDASNPWLNVVGVVGDVRHYGLDKPANMQIYRPHAQRPSQQMTLVVRTRTRPEAHAGRVREQLWAVDRDQPVYDIKTMREYVADSIAERRFSMLIVAVFACVALLLAVVGVYGVMSYTVAQRTHEIGVRMALGARGADILKLVIGQGMILALAGVVAGILAAAVVTRAMSSLLFGVSALDPSIFTVVAVLLAGVALLACYIPARRATRVDPLVALRYE